MGDDGLFGDEWLERQKLHQAADVGDLARVRELIAAGSPVNVFDRDLHRTPLHYAAIGGHVEVIRALISAGADVNAHDEAHVGETPLGEVAGNCSFEVAKVLIDAGADPRIPGWMQLTALDRAMERKRPEGQLVLRLLQDAARRFQRG